MVGTIVLFLVSLMMGRGNWRGAVEARWWEWTGGLFGAFFVTATIVAIPRIGTAATMAAVIAAQLSAGILLDHYGFFGFREVPFDLKRFMGMLLLLGGAWLVFRR
jgi:transporter family-2 protein